MGESVLAQIENALNRYRKWTATIKRLGFLRGSLYQSMSGNGYLQWWLRADGKKMYVRNRDVRSVKAALHRGQRLQEFEDEMINSISIAIRRNQRKPNN